LLFVKLSGRIQFSIHFIGRRIAGECTTWLGTASGRHAETRSERRCSISSNRAARVMKNQPDGKQTPSYPRPSVEIIREGRSGGRQATTVRPPAFPGRDERYASPGSKRAIWPGARV